MEELSTFAEVVVDSNKAQVSVIGKNLDNVNGLLEKTFAPLKDYKIDVIAQGSSYIKMSFVVDRESLDSIVSLIHRNIFG